MSHVEEYMEGENKVVDQIVSNLRRVYDPEIPTNVYDLGLIYEIWLDERYCKVTMTLTSAFCPVGDELYREVKQACEVPDVDIVDVEMTFEPPWGPNMIPTHTKLQMGLI